MKLAITSKFLLALLTLSAVIIAFQAPAQTLRLIAPTATDTVTPGQLLIVLSLPENHNTKVADYTLVFDGKTEVTTGFQLRQNMLSLIYTGPLEGGKHYFEVFQVTPDNPPKQELLVTHHFLVKHELPQVAQPKGPPPKTAAKTPPKPKFSGNLNFSSTDADVTGAGASLRQEPPFVRQIALNVNIPVGKGEIPIKAFYTTNSQNDFGYRNTLNIGYRKNGSSITLGDHFVNQDMFTFNGIRVRGVFLDAFFPNTDQKLKIRFMYGKNVDANNVPNTFPLPPDSSGNIFLGAMPKYERDYYFIQFYVQHSKYSHGQFAFVRVRDYSEEGIIGGITPKDNMAIAWEKYIPLVENRGYVRLNAAMAFTSFNNTLGGAPAFNFMIHLNSSTVPLTFKEAPQCAFGLAMSIPITKSNDFMVDARRIGASYYSLANPYMLNNRQYIRVADNLRLFKNRFTLSLSYDYMIDNLGHQRPQTRENSSVSGSASIRPGEKLPMLTIGYRYYLGNTFSNLEENYKIENTGIFGSLNYTLRIQPMTYQMCLTRNELNLISEVMANNYQQVTSLQVSATYKNLTGASVQGAKTEQNTGNINIPQQMFLFTAWYRFNKPAIRISFRAFSNTMTNEELGKEKRKGLQAGLDYTFKKYLTLGIIAGRQPFTSYQESRNYAENFLRLTANISL